MIFPVFVDSLNTAVHSVLDQPDEVALIETVSTATWIRAAYRAGVHQTDEGLEAWIGRRGRVGRRWSEAYDQSSIERLAIAFAALLHKCDAEDDG